MNTKKNTTAAALRADADAKIETWRALEMQAQPKRTEHNAWAKANPLTTGSHVFLRSSPLYFAHVTREIPVVEAENAAMHARNAVLLALDAAEVAEGDEIAVARDPRTLHADLVAFADEEREIEAKLAAVRQRRDQRVAKARQADGALAVRRRAADLPEPVGLPHPGAIVGGRVVTMLDALVQRIDHGVPMPNKDAQLADLRAQETRIAADLEHARREEEAQAKARADEKRWREEEIAERQRQVHAQERARQKEIEDERRQRDELAAAYKARNAPSTQ